MLFSPQPFFADWCKKDAERRLKVRDEKNATKEDGLTLKESAASDTWLARAVGGHVAWVMRQGVPVQPQASTGLDTPFLQALRKLEENPLDTPSQINVGRYFVSVIDLYLANITGAGQAYLATVDYIMSGDIQNLGVKELCLATGTEVEYGFQQWHCRPTPERARRPRMPL